MSQITALRLIDPGNDLEAMGNNEVNAVSQKVDRIIYLLEGEKDIPGLVARVATVEELLIGRKGNDGVVHQVRTMWRVHMWFLCTISGILGFILNMIVQKLLH